MSLTFFPIISVSSWVMCDNYEICITHKV